MKPGKSTITSSIAAGGRYDKIIGQFLESEEQYPAAGMTFGVDVIMEILKERDLFTKQTPAEFLIVPLPGNEPAALKLASRVRRMGINVMVDPSHKKIKNAIKYADKIGIQHMTIIGEDEINTNTVSIKCLPDHTERSFSIKDTSSIRQYINRLKD
jgi:histidyl-tRNA synthetase